MALASYLGEATAKKKWGSINITVPVFIAITVTIAFTVTLNPKPQTLNPISLSLEADNTSSWAVHLSGQRPLACSPHGPRGWGLGFRVEGLGFKV